MNQEDASLSALNKFVGKPKKQDCKNNMPLMRFQSKYLSNIKQADRRADSSESSSGFETGEEEQANLDKILNEYPSNYKQ